MHPCWRAFHVNATRCSAPGAFCVFVILPAACCIAVTQQESQLPEWSISLSLLAGFWFMLLLDTASHLLPSPSSSSSSSLRQPPDYDLAVTEARDDEHVILLSDMRQADDSSTPFAESSQPPTPRGSPRSSTPAPGTSHQPWPGVTPSAGVTTGTTSSRSAGGASVTGAAASDREARSSSRTGSPLKRPGVSSAGSSFRQLPLTSAREEAAAAAAEGVGAGSSSNLGARSTSSSSAATARGGAGTAGQKAAAAAAGSGGVQASRSVGAATGQLLSSWLREPAQQALLGLMVHAGKGFVHMIV
jgi:hypothetical protein